MNWIYTTKDLPKNDCTENVLFMTYSKVFKTGYWNGSSFSDDRGIKYSAFNEVVCWITENDLTPAEFDEQQAIIGKRE